MEAVVRRRQTPRGLATRAQAVLLRAKHPDWTPSEVGQRVGLPDDTVSVWCRRFLQSGIGGLSDAPKREAPRSIGDQQVEQVIRLTLAAVPPQATQWTTRSMARASSLTQSAVYRIWRAFGLRPHLTSSVQLSKDPLLIEKVRETVGVHLAPPVRALVVWVDEKPQIQTLERGSAAFPMRSGEEERTGHTSIRHGTTTRIPALHAKVGAVIGKCYSGHRAVEFVNLLEDIDQRVPAELAVHVSLGNDITHKTKAVRGGCCCILGTPAMSRRPVGRG